MPLLDDEFEDKTLWSSTDIGGDELDDDDDVMDGSFTDIGGDDRGLDGIE
jgi:hypothetical protein